MAEYNYYNLQEGEVVVNGSLHNGGYIFSGSEAAVADVTTSTLFPFSAYPGSHPHVSQPSMRKEKSRSDTFKNGKLKLYAEAPNPHDLGREKKRKKAVGSFNNRQASNLEFDVLQCTEVGLKSQIGSLEKEKIRLQRNVQNLEMQQQNLQHQAYDNTYPIPQEYQQGEQYSSCPPNFDFQ